MESETAVSGSFSYRVIDGALMKLKIDIERETDGRWIAEMTDLPGVLCYGVSRADAINKVEALALRVLADRLENGEAVPQAMADVFAVAP
jgi:predicted RNase H-like HicB family nuclease